MFSPSGRLFRIDQVPDNFKELFIMSGYRYPRSSAKQCIESMFQPHNEFVNIWTHLVPTLYFWWLTYQMWYELDLYDDAYMHPMLCFMISVCIFPSASCAAHIFNTMSDHARHICFFLDYCAINWYSMGGAVAFKAYVFPKALVGTAFDTYYLPIAAVNTVASTAISCHTRFMSNGPMKKALRMIAFAFPYFHDVVPLMYRILLCAGDDCHEAGLDLHKRQFFFAFCATFLYGSHLPERWYPGQFDIYGHSHQIFHVLCVFATLDQIAGVTRDLTERRDYLELSVDIPSQQSIALMLTVGATIIVTLLYYIHKLDQIIPTNAAAVAAPKSHHLGGGDAVAKGDDAVTNGELSGKDDEHTQATQPSLDDLSSTFTRKRVVNGNDGNGLKSQELSHTGT